MLEPHNVDSALQKAPHLAISSETTREEANAAFPMLAQFNDGGIYVGSFSGKSPWERHPTGDELLHVLEGEVEITLLTDGEPTSVVITAGSIFVVPRGLWHRQVARPTATSLSATPKPSEASFADDPRVEAPLRTTDR